MPEATLLETFLYILILRHMWTVHGHAKLSSASRIARSIDMPRSTVLRRLHFMETKLGAIERRGTRWALRPEFLNAPNGVEHLGTKGFKSRVARWHEAGKKMTILGD